MSEAAKLKKRIADVTARIVSGQVEAAEYHELHAERIALRRELRLLEEGA